VISTLTSLFVSFTITPTLAGLWHCARIGSRGVPSIGSVRSSTTFAPGIRSALCHGASATAGSWRSFAPGRSGSRWRWSARRRGRRVIPPVDRGEIFHSAHVSDRHPNSDRRERHVRSRAKDPRHVRYVREYRRRRSVRRPLWGFVSQNNVGQVHVWLKDGRKHSTDYWLTQFRAS